MLIAYDKLLRWFCIEVEERFVFDEKTLENIVKLVDSKFKFFEVDSHVRHKY